MRAPGSSLRTQVLVIWTGDGGAVRFVGAVSAVFVAVTVVSGGDAERVGAAELTDVAGWKTWKTKKLP